VNYEVGDIAIRTAWTGHVAMVYQSGNDNTARIIHARRSTNFHIEPNRQVSDDGSRIDYLLDGYDKLYRPPWGSDSDKRQKQRKLQEVAEAIKDRATYGIYRMFRLCLGSSAFGDDARARLAKYRQRLANIGTTIGEDPLVDTITCAEAVILCYQLTFNVGDPQFIELDAAHSMPRTLADWLGRHWGELMRSAPEINDLLNQHRPRAVTPAGAAAPGGAAPGRAHGG
jgi:hypothetical protein